MRKIINSITMLLIACMAMTVFAKPIELVINGKTVQSQVAPIKENGVTLVPLRVVSEQLDATVKYNQATKQITVNKEERNIVLTIGQKAVSVNGKTTSLQVPPRVISGNTMVPIRFISENLNCKVEWDGANQRVTITSKEQSLNYPIATIKIRGIGEVKAELYPSMAPNTVNNFIALANSKFYDGLTFHRVIDEFMIQGGCPKGDGTGGPGYTIAGEFVANGFKDNTLSHTEGILSMARTGEPNSAGSQFFIMTSNSPHLDKQYAAFGKVIQGMNFVEQIEKMKTDKLDKPVTPVVIESIRVDTLGIDYKAPEVIKL